MKSVFLPVVFFCTAMLSCQRQNSMTSNEGSLDGKWKMIIVKDNFSGSATTKPSSIQGEVEITFTIINASNGTFTGNTPTNDIWQNNFYVGANQALSIPVLSMTKVMETSWGNEFVSNICSSQTYSFDVHKLLHIKTTTKTLVFQKL